jgi:hypothetical protein
MASSRHLEHGTHGLFLIANLWDLLRPSLTHISTCICRGGETVYLLLYVNDIVLIAINPLILFSPAQLFSRSFHEKPWPAKSLSMFSKMTMRSSVRVYMAWIYPKGYGCYG